MYKFSKFMPVAMLATAVAFSFTSCSDDNDEPDPDNGGTTVAGPSVENVFANGLPASVDGSTFTTNDKGQLTSIKDGTTTITFEYGTFTQLRAHNFTVLMKERDSQDPTDGSDIYMELDMNGFVTYAYQVYLDDDDVDEWSFEYNTDGYLTKVYRTESNDTTTITHANGDIQKVVRVDGDGYRSEYTLAYTNDEYTSPVANKGCIMLYDEAFGVDLDEMEIVYYAGMLGKATKNLPMGATYKGTEGSSSYTDFETYHWEFNDNKLPIKYWEDDYKEGAITFTWK